MSSTSSHIDESEIHAFVDDQLPPDRVEAVQAYLEANPDEARRVAQLRQLNKLLQQRHERNLAEPVPTHLQAQAATPRRRLNPVVLRIAASVAWMVVGGTAGWVMHGQQEPLSDLAFELPRQAAIAHAVYTPEVLHPVEVTADQEAHLVAWLSKRLRVQLQIPQLNDHGYSLVGGRLLPGDNAPTAQFMYENAAGNRLTLYVKGGETSNTDTSFRYTEEHGVSVFFWVDGSLGYALSGEMDKNTLLTISTAVYKQLTP